MRSCEEFELLINLYLDDMLPSEETRPLKEHLKECQACRERYRQLSALKAALGDLDEPAPEGLHGRILDYVENLRRNARVILFEFQLIFAFGASRIIAERRDATRGIAPNRTEFRNIFAVIADDKLIRIVQSSDVTYGIG